MRRSSALDPLGVVRAVDHALAIAAALIAVALYASSKAMPAMYPTATAMAGPLLLGLLVAWVAATARMLVRRMRLERPQE